MVGLPPSSERSDIPLTDITLDVIDDNSVAVPDPFFGISTTTTTISLVYEHIWTSYGDNSVSLKNIYYNLYKNEFAISKGYVNDPNDKPIFWFVSHKNQLKTHEFNKLMNLKNKMSTSPLQ